MTIRTGAAELARVDEPPFRAVGGLGDLALVMLSSAVYPALDRGPRCSPGASCAGCAPSSAASR